VPQELITELITDAMVGGAKVRPSRCARSFDVPSEDKCALTAF